MVAGERTDRTSDAHPCQISCCFSLSCQKCPSPRRPTEKIGAVQLEKYQKFLEDYAKQLLDMEDALDENLSDSWNLQLDPVALIRFFPSFLLSLSLDRRLVPSFPLAATTTNRPR